MDVAPTILVVDDDELLRTTLAMALQGAGYHVETAANGSDGLEKALQLKPKLILIDYQMPEMNGVETIEKLRADPWGATVPIIFSTNVYDIEIINKVMQLNVKDYMLKTDMSLESLKTQVASYVPLQNN